MLIVSQLFIYPVKSLGGIAVPAATVTDRGFQYDRRWMLVDANNQFLTQRNFGQMALLQTSIHGDHLHITHKHTGSTIAVHLQERNGETAVAQIWDEQCEVAFVSSKADNWFSDQLGMRSRLAYMPDASHISVEEPYAVNNDLTSLSDGFPYLMIGQASLDALNSRLQAPITIDRFRPNIVFTGGQPHQEDRMEQFTINNIQWFGVKPSSRCVVTTINQQTGIKGKEPLHTLATYRRFDNKIKFGQNLLATGSGAVAIGDEISIVEEHGREWDGRG